MPLSEPMSAKLIEFGETIGKGAYALEKARMQKDLLEETLQKVNMEIVKLEEELRKQLGL